MSKIIVVALFCLISPSVSFAAYPAAKANHDLHEEVHGDVDRIGPFNEQFAMAVDGHVFWRMDGLEEFYHGIGHWTQIRTEVKPRQYLTLNLRTILYAGSISYGYTDPSGFYYLLGVSGELPDGLFGGHLTARGLDLERQTVGYGLIIQDREFAGLLLKWQKDDTSILYRGDGTGVLVSGDDTHILEVSLWDSTIRAGVIEWTAGVSQSKLSQNRTPYYYLAAGHSLKPVSFGVELGTRAKAIGGMAFIGYEDKIERFQYRGKVEARNYQSRFGEDFVGQIQQQYISYDQLDKSYTNPMNFFTVSDDLSVYAAHINLTYELSDMWSLESLNEIGQFAFRNASPENYYYYRGGVNYCPVQGHDDCLTFFASNKVLKDYYALPPHNKGTTNEPLFKAYALLGFEANFRF